MSALLDIAINGVLSSKAAWCRFITGNDTGKTGSHQSGFYIPKCASSLLFDKPGVKGENKEKTVSILWQDDFSTESRMKYYGQGTRNEYRITRFGKDFPFLQDDCVGDLIIIAKMDEENYKGYVLSSDDDIEGFFSFFNLSPGETNQLIDTDGTGHPDNVLEQLFKTFVSRYDNFPETRIMSEEARQCYNKAYGRSDDYILKNPDSIVLGWIDSEYELFKNFESRIYGSIIGRPFESIDAFLKSANEILNRRKSRAGKSLEHHLAAIFQAYKLIFEEQAVTEDKKKPDFLFPNGECYHNLLFPAQDLTILGAKTTCKDRWRQVLTEGDRVSHKHLFTLQQGVSKNQLKEMKDSNLTLVVPQAYKSFFPAEYRDDILDLIGFIAETKAKQDRVPRHFLM